MKLQRPKIFWQEKFDNLTKIKKFQNILRLQGCNIFDCF